jgi:polyisoprenyl-teichoic acid--peptidoglycan teichoic acid transferase
MSSTSPFRNIDRASGEHLAKRAWWLILLTLLVPGSAQIIAGNRRLGRVGIIATFAYWALFVVAAVLYLVNRSWLFFIVTAPFLDGALAIFLVAYAAVFAVLALDTLRLIRINHIPGKVRWITLAGILVVAVLGTSSIGYAGNLAGVQSNLMGGLFTQQGFTQPVDGRYNILLLGGDAARDRLGLRPDSMSVLSIDAVTGSVVNIGIPRNLQKVPFVKGSPMEAIWPNGYNCGDVCLVNAIYKDATDNHAALYPNAAAQGSNPGVEATKEAIEGVTGLTIQSYVLVDMAGFKALINALGGITINVTERLPIGGQQDSYTGAPINVQGWIEPGLQHMDGKTAIWYARSRHSTSDYDRMKRQREVEDAMLAQMEPATVLSHFKDIAAAGKQLLTTNIPNGMVSTYLDLALKAKKQGIQKLELVPPTIDVVNPNFTAIHAMIQEAIHKSASAK